MKDKKINKYNSHYAIFIAITVAALGAVYGYDTGNISGALPYLKQEMGLSTRMAELVSSAVVAGSILGAMFGGKLSNKIGRKNTMIFVSAAFVILAILSAFPPNVWFLIVVRFILGLSIGVTIVVAPVFIAEISPYKIRGAMLVTFQIATTIGISLASFVNLYFSQTGNWRAMLGVSAIIAFVLVIAILRFPDTPTWYIMKGHREKGIKTLQKLEAPEKVQSELAKIDQEVHQNESGKFSELFKTKYIKGTIFILGLGIFVQITGINAIVYYGPIIFQKVGFASFSNGILITGITQLIALIAEVTSSLIIDKWGRRKSLLMGISFMIIANIVLALLFLIGFISSWMMYLSVVIIFLFRVGYSFGFGSLVWVYASETLPSRLRSIGSSLILTANLVANLIVSMFFLTMFENFGGQVIFLIFGILAIISWIFVFKLAPETNGRTFEEIQAYWNNGGKWDEDIVNEKVTKK